MQNLGMYKFDLEPVIVKMVACLMNSIYHLQNQGIGKCGCLQINSLFIIFKSWLYKPYKVDLEPVITLIQLVYTLDGITEFSLEFVFYGVKFGFDFFIHRVNFGGMFELCRLLYLLYSELYHEQVYCLYFTQSCIMSKVV